jgi:hypothetical protein
MKVEPSPMGSTEVMAALLEVEPSSLGSSNVRKHSPDAWCHTLIVASLLPEIMNMSSATRSAQLT